MKILSVRQPWAHLIIHGGKDIENRKWKTNYRGDVLIHASKAYSSSANLPNLPDGMRNSFQFGGVIGVAELVDCVSASKSKWFEGPFGFVLRNPRPIPFIEWPGALGLRDVPPELVRRRIGEDRLSVTALSMERMHGVRALPEAADR